MNKYFKRFDKQMKN